MMKTIEFDSSFFDELGSHFDCTAAQPSMTSTALDSTVIDLDNLDMFTSSMGSPLSDDPYEELNRLSALIDTKNPFTSDDNITFENLFSEFDLSAPERTSELCQQTPSASSSVLQTDASNIPSIMSCIKLRPYTSAASTGAKVIKIEPTISNSNKRTGDPTVPVTSTNVPEIKIPSTTLGSFVHQANKIAIPPLKRRRSNSPTTCSQSSTKIPLTFDQLKQQYNNINEEALRKHLRMIRNRESASLSRKRRKERMENLDNTVRHLSDENEKLKKENSQLLTRIETLEMENELLRKYKGINSRLTTQPRKHMVLMGIALLVIFNVFAIKLAYPISRDSYGSITSYNDERVAVHSRALLSEPNYESTRAVNYNDNTSTEPSYPYIQCVAYINKTHSQRINRDLRSWVQDHNEMNEDANSVIVSDSKSLSLPLDHRTSSSSEQLPSVSRKMSRRTRFQSESNGQLQPYKSSEATLADFIHAIDRKNDTLYFVSFRRDHLMIPAATQNQTLRPKLSLILPASMAHLNSIATKSMHVPADHVPMIKIDCEVEDTRVVFVNRVHIPKSYRNDLFQHYSSASYATI